MTTSVLHVIPDLNVGGACRCTYSLAKYTSRLGDYKHSIIPIRPQVSTPEGIRLATEYGLDIQEYLPTKQLLARWQDFDIVHLHWWNNPPMSLLLKEQLPPSRLMMWFHVAGHVIPQFIAPELIDIADMAVASSPVCFESPSFLGLSERERASKTRMIYDCADLARVRGTTPKPHDGFTITYIGTVHFYKMHRDFMALCAAIKIPNARFIICGGGGADSILMEEARRYGIADRVTILGEVEDIRSVLEVTDVYGYPLCEDTYASGELNIQEAMCAGVPVVAFPHGGLSRMVVDNYTGYLVRTPTEYAQAIESLYANPAERMRLSHNCRNYAEQIFGAEHAATALHATYGQMLLKPKREKRMALGKYATTPSSDPNRVGSRLMMGTFGAQATDFEISATSNVWSDVLAAEARIGKSTFLMKISTIIYYAETFKEDPLLRLWWALMELQQNNFGEAVRLLEEAFARGLNDWRPLWYLSQVALRVGDKKAASNLLGQLKAHHPQFQPAHELAGMLGG